MAINLDTEIVATTFDETTRACTYTLERGGKRWTVQVPLEKLDSHGVNKEARRRHLENVLELAMQGPADGEMA